MSTPAFKIERGRAFLFEGVRIRFTGRARNSGRDYLFDRDDGMQVTFEAAELARVREANLLPDWVETRTSSAGLDVQPLVWLSATDVEKARAERRLDYCMTWAARPQTPRSEAGLQSLIAEAHARRKEEAEAAKRYEPPAPCARSVQNWIAEWQASDCSADALVTHERFRGNRASRFSLRLAELVAGYVDKYYLTEERLPVAAVHRKLVAAVTELNKKSGAPLSKPSYDAVRTAVSRLCPFTVDYCRRGAAYAREKWRAVSSGYITERPNEVWELDDTRADLVCTAEDGTVIGRPWIIVVIDRHTRMIMSFVISFHPPDTSAAMEALRRAILSKDAILEQHGLTVLGYPASGRPDVVHVDNAKHYNSIALKRALALLGIQHRTMPVLKAWYRAIVERAIGTLSRQVFHVVAGTTHSGIYERDGETPPESVAETTLAQAEHKLWKWLVADYCRNPHKGIEDTPLAMWLRYFRQPGNEMRLPLPAEKVNAALSLTVARKVRKVGLQFNNLVYSSERVVRLLMRPKAELREEVIIRIDRNDLTAIEFLDPTDNRWWTATLRHDLVARVLGRSLEEYDIARAMRRNRPDETEVDPDWTETYSELETAREKAAQDRRLGTRVRAAAERERVFKDARRLTEPKVVLLHPPADDLSSALDRLDADPPVPAQALAEVIDDFNPEAWAAAQGLDDAAHEPDAEA